LEQTVSEAADGKLPEAAGASKATVPPDASLDQLIHDASPETTRAVAADLRLTENLALSFLKRRDLPREALEALYKNKSVAKARKVQLAIVIHPSTPRHISVPVIRHLYAFELMQIALAPTVPADVKRSAEEAIVSRLGTVSSGERSELAKRSSGRVAAALLLDKEERIMQAALQNPQMTEVWIVKALKAGSGTELLAPAVSRHQKWSQRTEIKIALIANHHTPLARIAQFAAELPLSAVKEILRSARLSIEVKACLKRVLDGRSK
jgi:hypothetical protein